MIGHLEEAFHMLCTQSTIVWLLGSFQNLFLFNSPENTICTCLHGHKPVKDAQLEAIAKSDGWSCIVTVHLMY
jgi:hypothetical protein